MEQYWGGTQRGRTFDFNNGPPETVTIIGHMQANYIVIPPDAKLNTSIYEEAEVVV